jgi:hypothetical protein
MVNYELSSDGFKVIIATVCLTRSPGRIPSKFDLSTQMKLTRYLSQFPEWQKESKQHLVRSVTPGTFLYPGAQVHLQYEPEEFGRTADSTLVLQ